MGNIIKKRHLILISLILILIAGVAFVTYARQIWSSNDNNTSFDTTIGNIAGVKFNPGDTVNVNNLGPVLDYHDGANVEFAIFNRTSGDINVSVDLSITSISTNLKSSDFKWVLEKLNSSNVYEELVSGDFSGFVVGSNTIISSDSIGYGYSYYKFYVYIDGSVSNNSNMMSNSMSSVLVIGAE